ncbi:MAG: SufD family Fe-S cluster assembly protein [Eggerthellaceae bacterium]|nr:SufD family Fe-S cluster assembly protein [Eggerthellaceae bacterium]
MPADLSPIDKSLLQEIASIHGMPKGAFNIRKDGVLLERNSSANIEISTKTDNPGIDIHIKPNTRGETVYIPVIITESGLTDVVYNSFFIGENADVTIIAGCGIHNASHEASEHDGIHSFFCGPHSRVRYIEKHYGEGSGTGERILNPVTKVYMEKGSYCEMELTQLRGVSSTLRDTEAQLGEGAKLILTEKLLTHDDQVAVSNMKLELLGNDSSVQVISRSVAQGNSSQTFNPLVIGSAACRGHVQCDAIIMDKARVTAIPGIEAASEEAVLVHEAAIGKIAGEQIVKLMTLGLSEEEAEAEILADFLS